MTSNDTVASLTDHDLHAFVDGELDGRRYRQIVTHLASDQAAAERVNGYLRQQGELAALREQLADLDPVADEMTAELTRQLAGSMRHQRRVRYGAIASALAATMLIGMVSVWGPDPSLMAQRLAFSRQVAEAGPQMLFGRDPLSGAAQLVTGVISTVMLRSSLMSSWPPIRSAAPTWPRTACALSAGMRSRAATRQPSVWSTRTTRINACSCSWVPSAAARMWRSRWCQRVTSR